MKICPKIWANSCVQKYYIYSIFMNWRIFEGSFWVIPKESLMDFLYSISIYSYLYHVWGISEGTQRDAKVILEGSSKVLEIKTSLVLELEMSVLRIVNLLFYRTSSQWIGVPKGQKTVRRLVSRLVSKTGTVGWS